MANSNGYNLKSGWVKFIGVLIIINGIICTFSGVLILIGIPLIIAAVMLFKAAGAADRYRGQKTLEWAEESIHYFIRSFMVFSLMTIISFLFYFLIFIVGIILLIGAAGSFAELGPFLLDYMEEYNY